jgi:hypothetical protein
LAQLGNGFRLVWAQFSSCRLPIVKHPQNLSSG